MANSAGLCTSFKVELLLADHNFGTSSATRGSTGADTFKMALYQTTASIGPSSTAYTATGEVSSANYTAGGSNVTNATAPTSSGTTAYWTPSASVSWTTVTFTTDCALLYNSTRSNKAVGSYTFSSQTVTAGNFTLTMPTNAAATALIQIA
jgi:hypothetical protein